MENNNQETMNLGNNVGGGIYSSSSNAVNTGNLVINPMPQNTTEPLQTTVVQEPIIKQAEVKQAEVIEATQTPANQIPAENLQATEENEEEMIAPVADLIPTDKLVVETKDLKKMILQVRKLAICEIIKPLTQIFYLVFNKDGMRILATNDKQTIDIINKAKSYTQEVRISVDAKKFADFVLSLDEEVVEFVYNDAQNSISVVGKNGSKHIFAQRIDIGSGMALDIKHRYTADTNNMIPLEFPTLIDIINKSRPIRKLSSSIVETQGIYFSDIIISTDSNFMLLQNTIPSLAGKKFFMESDYSDLLSSLAFNQNAVKVGFTYKENSTEIEAIIISDGAITLSGAVKRDEGMIPLDVCNDFWNNSFSKKVTVSTKACINALKRAAIFIDPTTEGENGIFKIRTDLVELITSSGVSKDVLDCANESQYTTEFQLPVTKLLNVLQAIVAPTFTIAIDETKEECICLEYDSYKCIVALA